MKCNNYDNANIINIRNSYYGNIPNLHRKLGLLLVLVPHCKPVDSASAD